MTEIYRDIPGYEGRYQASNLGNIKGIYRGKETILKPETKKGADYQRVVLCVNGVRKHYSVHTLVLMSFVGPRPPGHECLHRDHNPRNNRLDNLSWDTRAVNCSDRPNYKPPSAKIDANTAYYIRFLKRLGISAAELSKELSLDEKHIHKIVRGDAW